MTTAEFAHVSTPPAAEVEVEVGLVAAEAIIDSTSSDVNTGLAWLDRGELDSASGCLSRATEKLDLAAAEKLAGDDGEEKGPLKLLVGRWKTAWAVSEVDSAKLGGETRGPAKSLERSKTAVRDRQFGSVLSNWAKVCGSDLTGTAILLGERESDEALGSLKQALVLCGLCIWAVKVLCSNGVPCRLLIWLSRCYLLQAQLPEPPLKCPGAPRADDERQARMDEWKLLAGPGRLNLGGGPELDFIQVARQTPDGQMHQIGHLFLCSCENFFKFDCHVDHMLEEHAEAGGVVGFPTPSIDEYHRVYYRHPHPPNGTMIRLEDPDMWTTWTAFLATIEGVLIFDELPPDDLFSPVEEEYTDDVEDDEGD